MPAAFAPMPRTCATVLQPFLCGHAQAFVQAHALDWTRVLHKLTDWTGPNALLLLTDAAVHGLPLAGQPIEWVAVAPQAPRWRAPRRLRMEDGWHCLTVVRGAELDAACAALGALAAETPQQRAEGWAVWDSGERLPRATLQQLLCGVSSCGRTPLLQHLPALSAVIWAAECQALHRARSNAWLAHVAGQPRATWGWCVQGTLAAMAAVMAQGGWVHGQRRSVVQRWTRVLAGELAIVDAAELCAIDKLWHAIGGPSEAGAAELAALDAICNRLLPPDFASHDRPPAACGPRRPYLPEMADEPEEAESALAA